MVLGVGRGVIVRAVSSFQRLKEWLLGWEKVERCPQFMSILIESNPCQRLCTHKLIERGPLYVRLVSPEGMVS